MDEILNTRQAAEKLGVSLTSVYKYIYAKQLKAHKLGGQTAKRHWRIKVSDLEDFVFNQLAEAQATNKV